MTDDKTHPDDTLGGEVSAFGERAKGAAKDAAGSLTGNRSLEREGERENAEGRARQARNDMFDETAVWPAIPSQIARLTADRDPAPAPCGRKSLRRKMRLGPCLVTRHSSAKASVRTHRDARQARNDVSGGSVTSATSSPARSSSRARRQRKALVSVEALALALSLAWALAWALARRWAHSWRPRHRLRFPGWVLR